MKRVFFIVSLFAIIYSCSKTDSTQPVVIKISGCDSIKQGLLKTTSDTVRLVSCVSITGCDSVRLGILKPNTQDTLRLLSCIKITGCDSVRLGLIKSTKDLLRLNCNSLSITIGTQKWMTVNLDIETYRNGDIIPQVTDPAIWVALKTGAWCYYNNDVANGAKYGKLYNWYAVNDSRGLAPQGWHIPSEVEWVTLNTFLGGDSVAGGKLKEVGTLNWRSPNTKATNETGFLALPGGWRIDGKFDWVGGMGVWWSTTSHPNSSNAWMRALRYDDVTLSRGNGSKYDGNSVRCLKD
jgi:uncharacterized protein (TIGR02145 family)